MSAVAASRARSTLLSRRRLRANVILALAADLSGKGAALLVLLVSARLLPVAQMAQLGVAVALAAITTTLFDFGASTVLTRDGAAAHQTMLGAAHRARALLAAVLVPAFALGGWLWGHPALALTTCALAFAQASVLAHIAHFRARQQFMVEAWAMPLMGLSAMALAVAGLLTWSRQALVVLLAQTIATAACALVLAVLASGGRRQPSLTARTLLRRSSIFASLAVLTLIYSRAETLLVSALSSNTQTAAYTLAVTLAFGLLAIPNALTSGLLPHLSAQSDRAGRWPATRRALCVAAGQGMLVALFVGALAPWLIPAVFGERYHVAVGALQILLIGNVLTALAGVIGVALIAARRQRLLAYQLGASLALSVSAAVVLIPRLGASGAAAALTLGEAVAVAMLTVVCRRELAGGHR